MNVLHVVRATRLLLMAAVVLLVSAFTGCGDGDRATPASRATPSPTATTQPRALGDTPVRATIVLDFLPNAVHAGVYRAQAAGYYRDANLDVRILTPTSTADTLKLIDAARADLGLADGIDVMDQIDAGSDAQVVQAITQRPLGAVIASAGDGIRTAKDLEGRTVGLTGVPSDSAVFEAVVRGAGGDPARVKQVTVGFGGAQALAAGTIDAFTGYWPSDAVALRESGTRTQVFSLDDAGGPAYPGLVAFSTRARIRKDRPTLAALVAATQRGYADAASSPQRALKDLLAANPALDRTIAAAQVRVYRPLWRATDGSVGEVDAGQVAALSAFLLNAKLIAAPVEPARFAVDVLR